MNIQNVTPAMVLCIYSGKPGCMCGCKGSYFYNPEHQAEGTCQRGYAVSADELDMAQVTRILRLVQAEGERVEFEDDDTFFVTARVDGAKRELVVKLSATVMVLA